MTKHILVLPVVLFIAGCTTTVKPADQIRQDYQTVNLQDGVSLEEALIIAKKEVLDHTPPKSYDIQEPHLVTDFDNLPHQDNYWFVTFKDLMGGSSTPLVYMVTIRKDNGRIVFSRSYSPLNNWILEAALLKLHEKPSKE